MEPLRPLTVSILSERRVLQVSILKWTKYDKFLLHFTDFSIAFQPYGMCGGEPGTCGRNLLIRQNGVTVNIGGRCSTDWKVGERLRLETPGAGGYGSIEARTLSDSTAT